LVVSPLLAEEPSSKPKDIPATRHEAKQALDALKKREARLPFPPPTEAELREAAERAASSGGSRSGVGGGIVNNGRMRSLYLPADLRSGSSGNRGSSSRAKDPKMTLEDAFGVELFWIASRANNCHYCLGHQEVKLRSAGLEESRIAALDADWSRFTPAEQAAYALARKLTLRPDKLTDADILAVLKHYEPLQVLEIISLVARYNATNRWTDSMGIPQENHREFLTATPKEFLNAKTIVAPERIDYRPKVESREETLAELAKARSRKPRLPLVDEATAKDVLGSEGDEPITNWARLLANFPVNGKGQIETYRLAANKGTLPDELKAQIAWTAARADRAWYAVDQAARRLKALGYDEDEVFALDQQATKANDASSQAMAFAAKLSATPQAIADADIAGLRKHYKDGQVAEIVYHVTQAALFDRITEAAGLPLEP
jgi:alkylhydroperoxidase family enzyme